MSGALQRKQLEGISPGLFTNVPGGAGSTPSSASGSQTMVESGDEEKKKKTRYTGGSHRRTLLSRENMLGVGKTTNKSILG